MARTPGGGEPADGDVRFAGLSPRRVDVWVAEPGLDDGRIARYATSLSPEEQARARRLRSLERRREYVLARGLLRHVLGSALGRVPQAVPIVTGEHGKPRLPAPATRPEGTFPEVTFNVSHTTGLVLVAATVGRAVGVDCEHAARPLEWSAIARRYLSNRENVALAALPPARRRDAFFACWVRKEALVKALGAGISIGLDTFDVNVDPDAPARFLGGRGPAWEDASWDVADLPVGPHHVACVAVRGGGIAPRIWRV